jgi:hypothetical protein
MVCTEQELWQVMHWRKNNLVSLFRMVSGDLKESDLMFRIINDFLINDKLVIHSLTQQHASTNKSP